ncbi:MAG: FecR domain-containing protein, partial [Gammaproteobacteria bacterium]|nr:FecR domain-containing protein [Gammaproteobacteria bacterium]
MDKVVQLWFCVLLFAWHLTFATTATAADCTPHSAKIVSVQGAIEVKRAGVSDWHPVNRNDVFCPGDSIRVGEQSRAAIVMANETLLRLDQKSAIKFTRFETELPSILGFIRGIGHFISRVPRSLKIETATVDAAIEGTEFVVAVSADETSVTVFEGTVLARNPQGEIRITDGETAIAKANAAPRKTLLAKPRDTVQWAVYFPPIIETDKLDNVSRASRLLAVGRVEEAQSLLQSMDSGEALALQTVIAIVNNEQERAFDFATDAVKRAPQSAAAHIAMSYAWQAKLSLDQAQASARQAVEHEPGNTIAWARLAELQLSRGELREALASAQQAIQQDATLSRTQSILGFAYLARIDIDEAMAVFN